MSDNGNGKVPIKVVQLLIEKTEVGIKNSQEGINKEIEELTEVMTTVINKINNTDKVLSDKLDIIKNKIGKMILVVTVAFSMLMGAVALSVFGSHLLYEHNKKISQKTIEKKDVKDINVNETKTDKIGGEERIKK